MFKSAIAYNDLVKELTITPHITAPDDLTPGEYWVGPLEVLFPEAYDDFSPHHLILEALDEAADKTGLAVQGATIAWGGHNLEFLTAPVAYGDRFMVHISDEKAAAISGNNEFNARTYIICVAVSDLHTYGTIGSDFKEGVYVSVHEPVTPSTSLNLVSFTRFTGEARDSAFYVFPK
jgi:hypothetical protein